MGRCLKLIAECTAFSAAGLDKMNRMIRTFKILNIILIFVIEHFFQIIDCFSNKINAKNYYYCNVRNNFTAPS